SLLAECEAYGCNQSNSAIGVIQLGTAGATAEYCIAHDNTGSGTSGFQAAVTGARFTYCIADTNGKNGLVISNGQSAICVGGDFYNNGAAGIDVGNGGSGVAAIYAKNCNFLKNGTYGVVGTTTGARSGYLINCGYGSGTQANSSGATSGLGAIQ